METSLVLITLIVCIICCCNGFFNDYFKDGINSDVLNDVSTEEYDDNLAEELLDDMVTEKLTNDLKKKKMKSDAWFGGGISAGFNLRRVIRTISRRTGTLCKNIPHKTCRKDCTNVFLGCYDVCVYEMQNACF